MAEKPSISTRWNNIEPSKTSVFWACAACIALTIFVGFKWGGWVTGGSARAMAETAAADARAELVAASCVVRFAKGTDAAAQVAKLRATDTWMRGTYLEKAGWVTFPGTKEPVEAAGELCAERILAAAPAATKIKN